MGFRPVASLDEALSTLRELGTDARIIAGGTDVMIQRMTGQLERGETLVHIERIEELRGVSVDGPTIRIGALTTHLDLQKDPAITDHLPSFAEAAATVGGWQTQEVGTLGGNLCNASPAADLGPPVLMADSVMTIAGPSGERSVPAHEFFRGRRQTALEPSELLTGIDVPLPPASSWETYLKVGRRSMMEVAIVGLAARFVVDDGVVADARLALCSVAPQPVRASAAEAVLIGSELSDEVIDTASAAAASEVEPIDDHRATASYRRTMTGRLVAKAAKTCRAAHDKEVGA